MLILPDSLFLAVAVGSSALAVMILASNHAVTKLIGIASTGGPRSARAVGGAVGHNPVSLIVPCHRVVGTDESLTGYAGGMDKKRFLLGLEGIDCHRLTDFLLE